MTMRVEFILPGHPPSVNAAFANNAGAGRGRWKTKPYKDWEALIWAECLKRGDIAYLKTFSGRLYRLEMTLQDPTWRYKNGNVRVFDHANCLKTCEDSICRVYGWRDEYNVETTSRKVNGPLKQTIVVFEFDFRPLA